ncbi:hypothetical protein EIP86_006327 [Pleurotus ostreatoroseus]|nr:hypothetical protein EIP86_006327 [Pleurotus ostreatoroseus]
MSVTALRDVLLNALATLPGTREFHIHTLVSAPHKHHDLFPYAHPRPKVYMQDVVVLLSEQASPSSPRVLVTAVELSVYNVPSTSCGILYISKVDTTGQGAYPSPTAMLVKTLLTYYADPATRPIHVDTLWLQLFARAQGQYLFPGSAEYPGKKPLADVKLCAWWKKLFSEVAGEVEARCSGTKTRLFYVLPGFNELEALSNLHIPSSIPPKNNGVPVQWTYGHHYSQTDIPLPCPPPGKGHNLGHYIPSFDDDPKSRFMDEIAFITDAEGVKSPEQKRPKTGLHRTVSKDTNVLEEEDEKEKHKEEKHEKPQGELDRVTADEFWERMSFRQECIAGAVTGFFSLGLASAPSPDSHATPSPLAPQPGQVAPRLVKRVLTSLMNGYDFSTAELAAKSTETLEGAIRGLCDGLVAGAAEPASTSDVASRAPLLFRRDTTPEPRATPAPATLEVPRTPKKPKGGKALPDVSPNPFPEPVASLETYEGHIYGSVSVRNPPLPPRAGAVAGHGSSGGGSVAPAQPVTVLTVRKKKRKHEP